jgi:hypothetical protein
MDIADIPQASFIILPVDEVRIGGDGYPYVEKDKDHNKSSYDSNFYFYCYKIHY